MRARWQCMLLAVLLACSPDVVDGQIVKTIKDHAAKKVDDRKKAADSTIVHATDKAVDSTLAKTSPSPNGAARAPARIEIARMQ